MVRLSHVFPAKLDSNCTPSKINLDHVNPVLRLSHATVLTVLHLLIITGDHLQQASTISNVTIRMLAWLEMKTHHLASVLKAMMASYAPTAWAGTAEVVLSSALNAMNLP